MKIYRPHLPGLTEEVRIVLNLEEASTLKNLCGFAVGEGMYADQAQELEFALEKALKER